jgi:hypothetical protein
VVIPQSGGLAGAQKAFAALQQDKQAIGQARDGQGSNSGAVSQTGQSSASSTKDLMDQLQQVLSSGDRQGVQQAFASIQQNANRRQHRADERHQHHGLMPNTPGHS